MSGATDTLDMTACKDSVAGYQHASTRRALWQLTNTFAPYALLWYAMYWAREVSVWLTVPLAVLSGAFLVRIFIIFHDCAHGSYLSSRRGNDMIGFIAGVLTFSRISTGAGNTRFITAAPAISIGAEPAMCGP